MDVFFSATQQQGFKILCRKIDELMAIKTKDGKNFIHICVESHRFSFIHINSYIDIYPKKIDHLFEQYDNNDETPIMLAARIQPKVFQQMLKVNFLRKLMINQSNENGENCFIIAAMNHPNILSIICEKYPIALEHVNDNGDSLLHLIVKTHPFMVENIREKYQNYKPEMINHLNNQQETYLHLMAKKYSEQTIHELTYASTELPELIKLCDKIYYNAVLNFDQKYTPLIIQTLKHRINDNLLMDILDIVCDKHDVNIINQLIQVQPDLTKLFIPLLAKNIHNKDKFMDLLDLSLVYAKLSTPYNINLVTTKSKLGALFNDLFNVLIKQKMDDKTFDIFLDIFLRPDLNGHYGHVYQLWLNLYRHPEYLKKFLHSPRVTIEHTVMFYVNNYDASYDHYEIYTMLTDITQRSPENVQVFLDSPQFNKQFYDIQKFMNDGLYKIVGKTRKDIEDRTIIFDPVYIMMKKFLIDGIDL
jgi:hypothetical protein